MPTETSPDAPVQTLPRKAHVLYDGLCPLCLKSVALLKRLDWFKRVDYVNAREPDQVQRVQPAGLPPLEPKSLLQEMHLLTSTGGHVYHGFQAFRWMAWRLPLLWPLAPFLYVPGVPWLGQKLYLWVARNRFRLVPCHGGVCSIQRGT
jgi:predicted DCC family thiol-disulfide oxidoreductase YuxK